MSNPIVTADFEAAKVPKNIIGRFERAFKGSMEITDWNLEIADEAGIFFDRMIDQIVPGLAARAFKTGMDAAREREQAAVVLARKEFIASAREPVDDKDDGFDRAEYEKLTKKTAEAWDEFFKTKRALIATALKSRK